MIDSRSISRTLAAISLIGAFAVQAQSSGPTERTQLPTLPVARSPFVLEAVTDPATGRSAFSFAGKEIAPVIRTAPGEQIRLEYRNRMSTTSQEMCVYGPCKNMTNLHFHGLHVSPDAPQDDVISMMAMPGDSLHYVVDIPNNQPSGLYWYHT